MLVSVKVQDYMTTNLITFSPETDIFEAIDVLLQHRISGAPVTDTAGQLVGMFSESDCLKTLLKTGYYEGQAIGGIVKDFMATSVDVVDPEDDVIAVAEIFLKNRRRRLPVVDTGRLAGQISRRDILRAMKDFAQKN